MASQVIVCKDHLAASRYAADLAAKAFAEKLDLTLTFAAGDTPMACYRELIQRRDEGALRLDLARYIGLDEWVGLGPETDGSCIASMNRGFYHPAGISAERIAAFDGLCADVAGEAERMRGFLRDHPLELAVLGVGVNGHIGFNEPGVPLDGDFSLVPLSETTQRVGKKYFGGNATPTQGATITLHALQKAKRVIVIATGANKREAVAGVLAKRTDLPVCAFLEHPGAVYVFDEAAAG